MWIKCAAIRFVAHIHNIIFECSTNNNINTLLCYKAYKELSIIHAIQCDIFAIFSEIMVLLNMSDKWMCIFFSICLFSQPLRKHYCFTAQFRPQTMLMCSIQNMLQLHRFYLVSNHTLVIEAYLYFHFSHLTFYVIYSIASRLQYKWHIIFFSFVLSTK